MTNIGTKQELRSQYLEMRNSIPLSEVEEKSDRIFERFCTLFEIENANRILVYLAIDSEVQTRKIVDFLKSKQKEVYVPKFTNGNWKMALFKSWDDLETGPFGISQPKDTKHTDDVDMAIIPGVAFDKKGVRLGFGKGIFDNLLSESEAIKVGLCFGFQIADSLPKEEHDLVMDILISDEGIVKTI